MTYTVLTNLSDFSQFAAWTNDLASGYLFTIIVSVVFFIILIKMLFTEPSFPRSLAAASFVALILSGLFGAIELVPTSVTIIFLILTAIAGVWMHAENAGNSF